MILGVGHIAIAVDDLEKSVSFYRDVLGYKVVRTFDRPEVLGGIRFGKARVVDLSLNPGQIGEVQLIKYIDDSDKHPVGLDHIGMLVSDMDSTVADLKSQGVTFITEPSPSVPPFPRVATILDPDTNVPIELITFVPGRDDQG